MSFTQSIKRPPITLTDAEQASILRVTGDHKDGFRDHVLIAVALGTALREFEISSLNCGDVFGTRRGEGKVIGTVKRRITLEVFKRSTGEPAPQHVFVPDALVYKLRKFASWKRGRGESLALDAPLFVSRNNNRLATRSIRDLFGKWQRIAEFDRHFTFHHLRHTAITNVYRSTGDIRLAQRVARHKNINTTTIYASPTDEDVLRAVRDLPC